ncbi:hypothetical protein BDR26DRAFT_1008423 [Obelidium mucronatum]|nr:hypothetical protein BDR26DRAFT_1008423 [Obelidium mucronatum]
MTFTAPQLEAIETATAFLSTLESDPRGFKPVSNDPNLIVSTKAVTGSVLPVVKAQIKLTHPVPFDAIIDAFKVDGDQRKKWDLNLDSAEIIDASSDEGVIEQLIHVRQKAASSLVSARDTLVLFKVIKESEARGRIVTTSVVDPRVPEVKGYTRAHAFLVGWVFEKNESGGGGWNVTYFNHNDAKVSSFLVSKVVQGLPQVAVNFATYMNSQ